MIRSLREVIFDGQKVGHYEVLGEIASGGMATVYLATAEGSSRFIAVKRLHPHMAGEEQFIRMFVDEAFLASRIRHPNVVAILDIDDADGLSIVMEYVDGGTLQAIVTASEEKSSPIPAGYAVRMVLDVLAGLQAAHDLRDQGNRPLGLIHRDISPHNILVGNDGLARITDFGIAKATMRLSQTREGVLKGKLSYMAPEQLKGGDIDRRVDVFTTGIVAWELLARKRLFAGESDARIYNALMTAPIPQLKAQAPELPDDLCAVVMKALARDPAQRWQSCLEFSDALDAAASQLGDAVSHRQVGDLVRVLLPPALSRLRVATGRNSVPAPPTASGLRPVTVPPGSLAHPPPEDTQPDVVASAEARYSGVVPAARADRRALWGGLAALTVLAVVLLGVWRHGAPPAAPPRVVVAPPTRHIVDNAPPPPPPPEVAPSVAPSVSAAALDDAGARNGHRRRAVTETVRRHPRSGGIHRSHDGRLFIP